MLFITVLHLSVILHYAYSEPVPVRVTPILGSNRSCSLPPVNLTANEAMVTAENCLNIKNGPPPCKCAQGAEWKRLAFLDMEDGTNQCPNDWELTVQSGVRGCKKPSRLGGGCSSAIFDTQRFIYNRLCGRVLGYQIGTPEAFNVGQTVEGHYIDGVSLTHGPAGNREHIWAFIAAIHEESTVPSYICSCTSDRPWNVQIQEFIGNNYFCGTGDPNSGTSNMIYTDDLLWGDGKMCGPMSTCCEFNKPPWFCTSLPRRTNDPLELRICGSDIANCENILVTRVEIFGPYSNIQN